MIILGDMVPYIGLRQKWPAAEVKATGDQTILDRKLFTSLGANFHCDSIEIFSLTLTYKGWFNNNDLFLGNDFLLGESP